MPVVAPLLGAYLGGIIYVVFVGSTIPQSQILENPVEHEDRTTPVLPKNTPQQPAASSLPLVSVSPDNRPSVQPVPPLSDSICIEPF